MTDGIKVHREAGVWLRHPFDQLKLDSDRLHGTRRCAGFAVPSGIVDGIASSSETASPVRSNSRKRRRSSSTSGLD
jgi:hypothetical protein